jgi:type VI protein secretion system component VasF
MPVNQPEEPLTKFEQELMQAMRAFDPPEGFAERVMERAQASEQPRAKIFAMPRRLPLWTSGAIAAALLLGVFFGVQTHLRQQREQAELAQQQFELAMRITDRTLEHTRQQLWSAGVLSGTD